MPSNISAYFDSTGDSTYSFATSHDLAIMRSIRMMSRLVTSFQNWMHLNDRADMYMEALCLLVGLVLFLAVGILFWPIHVENTEKHMRPQESRVSPTNAGDTASSIDTMGESLQADISSLEDVDAEEEKQVELDAEDGREQQTNDQSPEDKSEHEDQTPPSSAIVEEPSTEMDEDQRKARS